MSYIIRDAHDEDIQDIIELRKQLDDVHAEMMPNLFASAYLYSEDDIKSYFNAEKSKIIVIKDSDANGIAAYAILNKERIEEKKIFKEKSMIYVNDICVRKENRGKGIGKLIFEYVIKYAKDQNVDTVELNVFSSNERAIRLYESFGLIDQNKRMVLRL